MLKPFAGLALAATLSLGLSGCFQPLHGPQFGGIRGKLADVEVAQIEGHLGHQLKSELDFLLTNGTPPAAPVYRLTAKPSGSIGGIIVDNSASTPQTNKYYMFTNYTLVSIKDGKIVSAATAQTVVSFDRDAQRLASIRAQRDAEIRGAKILAEQIRARIIADLAKIGS